MQIIVNQATRETLLLYIRQRINNKLFTLLQGIKDNPYFVTFKKRRN